MFRIAARPGAKVGIQIEKIEQVCSDAAASRIPFEHAVQGEHGSRFRLTICTDGRALGLCAIVQDVRAVTFQDAETTISYRATCSGDQFLATEQQGPDRLPARFGEQQL